jgi:arginase family enzyme
MSRKQRIREFETVHIIGGDMDLGTNQRAVSLGPKALRAASVKVKRVLSELGYKVVDHGDIIANRKERLRSLRSGMPET